MTAKSERTKEQIIEDQRKKTDANIRYRKTSMIVAGGMAVTRVVATVATAASGRIVESIADGITAGLFGYATLRNAKELQKNLRRRKSLS